MSRAMARARSNSSPSGTTWLTMPRASARSAVSLSSPVSNSSFAAFGPAIHGSSSATAPDPKRTSGTPNLVPTAAMVMSQASDSSKAPPMQIAVHRGDGRLRAVPETHDESEIVLQHLAPFGRRRRRRRSKRGLHVEAGGEGAACAAHDYRHDAVIVAEFRERRPRLADQGRVEGVQHLLPVEGENCHALLALDADRLVGHPGPFN